MLYKSVLSHSIVWYSKYILEIFEYLRLNSTVPHPISHLNQFAKLNEALDHHVNSVFMHCPFRL